MTAENQSETSCFENSAPLQPLIAANMAGKGIVHGFFLRTGGVSGGIYSSLNCGRGSSDERSNVEENRARVASYLGAAPLALIGPRQIHSARAVTVREPWTSSEAPEADAIVTGTRGLAISVLTADCAPVLMADAEAGVAAAVHAGWKGAKAGIIESALDAMETLGARLDKVVAVVGPAISKRAYEVGPEFRDAFLAESAVNDKYFECTQEGGRPHFDLASFICDKLATRGVGYIEDSGLCTYENESILFSHRRSVHRREADYGRQISAILLS
jgi:YfiH family protein